MQCEWNGFINKVHKELEKQKLLAKKVQLQLTENLGVSYNAQDFWET